ncbi:hypothetical protein ENSA5_00570 [Enhygromyxa salina]|uniref:Uncharacterized protein n=1 Tax=Enhygromyxa salina TaxID=215803 RepID=A0A2S9YKU3_9BACT|nr:hypothetical protein [Enhygromyxa salina]PRQ05737.1 hypothetical protein ENSA5_00570 [Enhygromyxa salina]
MPTHQGKTQTDIVIGDAGDSASEATEFEFVATHAGPGSVQFVDYAPGTDRQFSGYELVVTDVAGSPVATMAARYKAWIDVGTATGKKEIDIQNLFNPAPAGSRPDWPLSPQTSAERVWQTETFDSASNLYAKTCATWQVRTTVISATATVMQTIVDQDPGLLRVHLVYLDGAAVILDVVATMIAATSVTGNVTADPPDVTDTFSP